MSAEHERPRIVLADDHRILLEGLCTLLASDFNIVGTATDGREAVALTERLKPDAVVLDIGLPLMNGVEAASRIAKSEPAPCIVILSQHSIRPYIDAAFAAGATAYVAKQSAATDLRTALQRAMEGSFYLSESLREYADVIPSESAPRAHERQELTARQREILQLVAEGKSAKEAAAILGVSVKTVEFHKAAIMERLGLRTTAELTRYAVRRGIVND